MALAPVHACFPASHLLLRLPFAPTRSLSLRPRHVASTKQEQPKLGFCCKASGDSQDNYLIDAPVSVGDGFSFAGGKYSDGPNPSDQWFSRGKIVKAHQVLGNGEKAKDPIFGLAMGGSSQTSADLFRWFYVEDGNPTNPKVILIHGFPSQAYSYRKLLPILSTKYHVIAFDWIGIASLEKQFCGNLENNLKIHSLGFGFSDKPQPGYGFNYTLDEYVAALESFVHNLGSNNISLVVQGYFAPIVTKYASSNKEKPKNLVLLNPPLTAKHAKLPPPLASFNNFLFGDIFAQDPLRASDKTLTSGGPYAMKEEDAMVYRRPYLTSGSSGFALTAISRAMKRDIKVYIDDMQKALSNKYWTVPTNVCWGRRDRWLSYEGVKEFCKYSNSELVELPLAGHHLQEDVGGELGNIILDLLSKN